MGRTFLPEEEKQDANPVVIVSRRLWVRRFGSDPNPVGQTINVDNKTYTVPR
jgi:hypothetical protein